jgi:hypothetical protein
VPRAAARPFRTDEEITMEHPTSEGIRELLDAAEAPCLSLYQPTHRHHPDNAQDPIRFRNLVRSLDESLREGPEAGRADALLAPFRTLAEDTSFWNCTLDGLAVFGGPGAFRVFRLQRAVPELAVVAESFHCKPLLRVIQSAFRYQVLALTRDALRLYEGDRYALDEIEPAPGVPRTMTDALGEELTENTLVVSAHRAGHQKGSAPGMWHGHGSRKDEVPIDDERWFRAADRAVTEHHSKASGLPLLLVALAEHQGMFRSLTQNALLLEQGIAKSPDAMSMDELREEAWRAVEPQYVARMRAVEERFGAERAKDRAAEDLGAVAEAAVAGRVDTLLVEADRQIPGRLDRASGQIRRGDLEHPEVDDLLDDLAEQALRTGAEVLVVPADRMPTRTGAAAIFRY